MAEELLIFVDAGGNEHVFPRTYRGILLAEGYKLVEPKKKKFLENVPEKITIKPRKRILRKLKEFAKALVVVAVLLGCSGVLYATTDTYTPPSTYDCSKKWGCH